MQTRNLILILSIGALAALGGCERHSWEETSRLHQAHGGDHGDGHGEGGHHGDGEKEKAHDAADHGKDAEAHSKKEEHPEPKAEKKDAGHPTEKTKGEPRKL